MAEGVGFVPKTAIFWVKFSPNRPQFNYNPTLLG
jgi:hypothetical protein